MDEKNETLQHNTVNEDLEKADTNEAGFGEATREEVVGSPVISEDVHNVYHEDVDGGPYGHVKPDRDKRGRKRSEAQLRARKAIKEYEKLRNERRRR